MIILAEDDADHRLSLRLALQLEGYSVRDAPSGQEAIALQRERPSRLLITDIFMPEGDGFELVTAFRREFPETKIVVISGGGKRTRRNYLETARIMGVDATLQKPFDTKALIDVVRGLAS